MASLQHSHSPGTTRNILVVDDSPVERYLAISMVTGHLDCTANGTASGEEALMRIRMSPVDLVLTDLRMPDMDGLELLRTLKREHPLLPVVVMTADGTEETVVAVLQGGADGYLSKRRLAEDVVDVVQQVLRSAERSRNRAGLSRQLSRQLFEYELENNLRQITPLQRMVVESCHQIGVIDDYDRVRVGVAIEEALTNAVVHGNLEVSSELRRAAGNAYEQLIRRRQRAEPYASRRVTFHCELTRDLARIMISDCGPGFNVGSLPDPRDARNLARPSGRGVLLMRTFMDSVEYNETGNQVTLVKYRCNEPEQERDDVLNEECAVVGAREC